MRTILGLLTALMLLCSTALAANTQTLELPLPEEAHSLVETTADTMVLTCAAAGEEITVTVTTLDGQLLYERMYGACSGTFRSEPVYLRMTGSETTFLVSVRRGAMEYAFTVIRRRA